MENKGMVGVKSVFGRYLQANSGNGEMHASNERRNEEETWFLIEIDAAQHIYALQSWKYGKFMRKNRENGCANAESTVISPTEQWILHSGQAAGVVNAVAFRSVVDRTLLGSNRPGQDDNPCGGEVSARDAGEIGRTGEWPGWWVLEPAETPSPGRDPWNTVGGFFEGMVNRLTAADVAAIIAAIAAA